MHARGDWLDSTSGAGETERRERDATVTRTLEAPGGRWVAILAPQGNVSALYAHCEDSQSS